MSQTRATVLALERDEYRCQWCLHKRDRCRDVHWFTTGDILGGGHHILKRAIVDEVDAIISLCSECHTLAERHFITQKELLELLSEIVGYNLIDKYRQFCSLKTL